MKEIINRIDETLEKYSGFKYSYSFLIEIYEKVINLLKSSYDNYGLLLSDDKLDTKLIIMLISYNEDLNKLVEDLNFLSDIADDQIDVLLQFQSINDFFERIESLSISEIEALKKDIANYSNNKNIEVFKSDEKLIKNLVTSFDSVDNINRFIDICKSNVNKDMIDTIVKAIGTIYYVSENEDVSKKTIDFGLRLAISKLNSVLVHIKHEENKYYKQLNKEKNILEQLKVYINNNINNYIYLDQPVNNLIKYVTGEEELKKDILNSIYNHNDELYQKIHKENNEESSINKFERIMIDYKLKFMFSKEIFALDEKSVENKLEILKDIEQVMDNKEVLEEILLYTSEDDLQNIINYMNEFKVSIEFIISNKIFTDNSKLFLTNVQIIQNENIKLENSNILLLDTKQLLKRINLTYAYNINLRKNKNNNDDFLSNSEEAFKYFDNYIELGYYSFIRNHLPYCKEENENILKRLNIALELEMDVLENDDLSKEILTGKSFLVGDNSLDEFIFSYNDEQSKYKDVLTNNETIDCDYSISIIKDLDDNFLISDYEYDIQGIIISRIKVIRNLTTLLKYFPEDDIYDLVYSSMINNSCFSADKIYIIKNALSRLLSSPLRNDENNLIIKM